MENLSKRFTSYAGILEEKGIDINDIIYIQNLIDKKEKGLLFEIPCKVGDNIYVIVGKDISKQKVKKIEIPYIDGFIVYTKRRIIHNIDFGRKVFLTRIEAETALKDLK